MKLLRVSATNFKNCCDNITIDFIAKSKKTSEDKEYELQEITDGLYTFNTLAFIGKNASGKTSAVELLKCSYDILSEFRLYDENQIYDNVDLELIFYNEGYIYKYNTILRYNPLFGNNINFTNEHLYYKQYFKTKIKDIYNDDEFIELNNFTDIPEDTSKVFFVLKKKKTRAIYFDCNGYGVRTYRELFKTMKIFNIDDNILMKVIKIFDENVKYIKMIDENHYLLKYNDYDKELSDIELLNMLSSGTTKGVLLYIYIIASLSNGFDIIIDEIENHFHKSLVDNIIALYKDKHVNKYNASLIFTTHYCLILDLFNRQDNIWIAKANDKIHLFNMYESYNTRSELLKSKQFYNNTFETAVNYNDLMALKKELMRR